MEDMKNIYGDNVSWFCLEGSVTLEEQKQDGEFVLDDEFEVYGEDLDGNEGSVSIDVIKLLESAHVYIESEKKSKDRLVEENAELRSNQEELLKDVKFLFSKSNNLNELQSKNISSMIKYNNKLLNK